jgi:uncharacterized damage-inducible protein DinB
MTLPPFVHRYHLIALEGTPAVLECLTNGLPADSPVWDARPDPERFSLRETLAHLADWEEVFFSRIIRTRDEEMPDLPHREPDELAIDYASRDPNASVAQFRERRAATVAAVRALAPEQWQRAGRFLPGHPAVGGPVTIEAWVAQTLAHDGYHLRQIAEHLSR